MKIFQWPRQRRSVEKFFERASEPRSGVERTVEGIIESVRADGDHALVELTEKFDGVKLRPRDFEIPASELEQAWDGLPGDLRAALRTAARRIEAFHKKQRLKGWVVNDPDFGRMEMHVAAVDRAGIYAPGGRAAYPSTVLMNAIPARVAGVGEIILMTPPGADGSPEPVVLAAAHLAGVDRVFRIGGAQAIAAMAHGTKTIPRVDKIVGPGNVYVATAKRMLFGLIDIESIAGPTEVLILADDTARMDFLAADLLAQAEHDPEASAGVVLIGGTADSARALVAEVRRQLKALPRNAIASASIRDNGYVILASSADEAVEIANLRAPEHLQIMARGARSLGRKVRHAGAIFIGPYTPEPVGDYIAGPNHTLPTGGTARFFSPLSVWTFYKTWHTVESTRAGLARYAEAIETLAESEGLSGHAESVRVRFRKRGR